MDGRRTLIATVSDEKGLNMKSGLRISIATMLAVFLILPLLSVSVLCAPELDWNPEGVPLFPDIISFYNDGEVGPPMAAAVAPGKTIVTWADNRSGDWNIYAQKIHADGTIDPSWDPTGAPVCTAPGDQLDPRIIADGNGKAIIAWRDKRSGDNWEIYAKRIGTNGNPASGQWPSNGLAIASVPGFSSSFAICTDGASGVYVAYKDYSSLDLMVANRDLNGFVPAGVPSEGLCVFDGTEIKGLVIDFDIASDGDHGAMVAWSEVRLLELTQHDIRAQRLSPTGELLWEQGGIPVCTVPGIQLGVQIERCDKGSIIAWSDSRNYSETGSDIYAQKVLLDGTIPTWQYGWTAGGEPVCTATGDQDNIDLMHNGFGGAIITWQDQRYQKEYIFAQRMSTFGFNYWPENGVAVFVPDSTQTGFDVQPRIVTDGHYGAIITWNYGKYLSWRVYAQRVDKNGMIASGWPETGLELCDEALGNQRSAAIVSDGVDGAIVAWHDFRGSWGAYSVYAQKVSPEAPTVTGITPNIADPGQTCWVTINGAGFLFGAKVTLEREGAADLVANNVSVVNSGKIKCKITLDMESSGFWSVCVENTNGKTGILEGVFIVRRPPRKPNRPLPAHNEDRR